MNQNCDSAARELSTLTYGDDEECSSLSSRELRENIRVIVIGAGPVGVRFAHELLKRQPHARLQMFGDEPFRPYNRVQLSALLAGEVKYDDIISPLPLAKLHPKFESLHAKIIEVNTQAKYVKDEFGKCYDFDKLVFATGSRSHVPNIPGVDLAGVFTFRNLKDAEALYGRIARARQVVVLGGGLLGLEAAKALHRANTQVTVVQQGPRLMNRQLDEAAAALLLDKVTAIGIEVVLNSGVRQIAGDSRVEAVVTRDGRKITCDTVLICAGIRPVVELARASGIKLANGILVNDALETSEDNVFAIGECCEHRGKTYGLVNPGFEQAAVAAESISAGSARYVGSLEVSRLKVLGEHVASLGQAVEQDAHPLNKELVYRNKKDGIYRKLVIQRGLILGAVGFGEWPELRRIQEAYHHQRRIRPWNRLRFFFSGTLWDPNENEDPALWPASTVVCQCNNITQGVLTAAVDAGCNSTAALCQATGAGGVCGSCQPLLIKLVGGHQQLEKESRWRIISLVSVLSFVAAMLIAFLPAIEVSQTAEKLAFLEFFWNDKFWKQFSGFSILGMTALGLLMSLRKRIRNDLLGKFAHWRLLHIMLGLACAAALLVHTGMHLGVNLNRALVINFLLILAFGALAGLSLGLRHKFSMNTALRLRKTLTWGHILVFWPFPILIALHIFSVYYY